MAAAPLLDLYNIPNLAAYFSMVLLVRIVTIDKVLSGSVYVVGALD